MTTISSHAALAILLLALTPAAGVRGESDDSSCRSHESTSAEISRLRLERGRLLDLHRGAEASDDDAEAEEFLSRIEKISQRILDTEERHAASHGSQSGRADDLPGGLTQGLVLFFPFRSSEGRKISDLSEHGNNGASNGAVWSEKGRRDGCYWFDGIDDFIEVPCSHSLRTNGEFTLSLCLFPTSHPESDEPTTGYIISKSSSDSADYWLHLSPSMTVGGGLNNHPGTGGTQRIPSDPARHDLKKRRWTHVVMSISANTAKLYLNGSLDKTVTLTDNLVASDAPLLLGRCGLGEGNHAFTGRVDDLAIWNRALSEAEVLGLWVALKRSADDQDQLGALRP